MVGIYCIRNVVNKKVYVGSSVNIDSRWSNHRTLLKTGKHRNQYLQRAWDKYGEQNFEFKVLQECGVDDLPTLEVEWMNFFSSCKRSSGYNLVKVTDRKQVWSESVLQKKSDATRRQWSDQVVRDKMVMGLKQSWVSNPKRAKGATKSGMSRRDTRKVGQFDLDGNLLTTYASRREAYLENGKCRNIYKCLSGEIETCQGKAYTYLD
jgi:group I intron endonuclease